MKKKVKISYENFIAMAPSAAGKRTKQENPLRHENALIGQRYLRHMLWLITYESLLMFEFSWLYFEFDQSVVETSFEPCQLGFE